MATYDMYDPYKLAVPNIEPGREPVPKLGKRPEFPLESILDPQVRRLKAGKLPGGQTYTGATALTPLIFPGAEELPALQGLPSITPTAPDAAAPATLTAPAPGTIAVSGGGREFTGIGEGPYTAYAGEAPWAGKPTGSRVSVLPMLGPDPRVLRELSAARQAAADRGDWKSLQGFLNPGAQAEPDLMSMSLGERIAYGGVQRAKQATEAARQNQGMLALKGLETLNTLEGGRRETAVQSAKDVRMAEYLNEKTTPERRALLGPLVGGQRDVAGFEYEPVPVFSTEIPGVRVGTEAFSKRFGKTAGAQATALPPGLKVGAATKQADGTYTVGNKTVTIQAGKVNSIT